MPNAELQSMLLTADAGLAEVPGCTREQLDALARSVELRRQQLEADIRDYIAAKQAELRRHGHELADRYRDMACDQQPAPAVPEQSCLGPAQGPAAPLDPAPDDRMRHKKHTRVHKRERELYGLVTPVFLPLLDARDSSPEKKKTPAAGHAEHARDDPKPTSDALDTAAMALREPAQLRLPAKKSALRHKDTPRSRRKRVSLVIHGQTVLPADTVAEPPLASPSSVATSASTSTASLDDMIDPRLTTPDPPVHVQRPDAVHHSLPLPMTNAINSASKLLSEAPTPISVAAAHIPPVASPRSPSIPLGPTQTATPTFLDPSPALHQHITQTIPDTAGPDPIYSTAPATSAELEIDDLADDDTNFDTYVGGLHGSGVDDVDQAGSYGYPSSLGASYMESYMQNRPLSVRMQAANKAGLADEEKRRLLEQRDNNEAEAEAEEEEEDHSNSTSAGHKAVDATEDNFMGDMDDF